MLRHKYISIFTFFVLCIAASSVALGETADFKDYTVTKGDTLWDISNKELKDPFLWPKVWKENSEIKNPDLIYPHQKIRIPLYLLQKEIKPEVKQEIKTEVKPEFKVETKPPQKIQQPVQPAGHIEKEYLVEKNLLIVSGYITESVHSVGEIYDSPSEMSTLVKGDSAFIKVGRPVKKGEKFYIIYPVEQVKHPVTHRSLGVRIAILGIGEVTDELDPKILVKDSFVEIPIGSLIDDYYEIKPPLMPINPRKPDITGYVVTALRRIVAYGNWDIVFIDKGEKDGLLPGDLLSTTWRSEHKLVNGIIQIISTKPSTSAAVIRKVIKEIQIGDMVIPVTQE